MLSSHHPIQRYSLVPCPIDIKNDSGWIIVDTQQENSPSVPSLASADDHSFHSAPNLGRLKLDGKGSITYHGATGFFHLPAENAIGNAHPDPRMWHNFPILQPEGLQRRERLVHNAWQQRALESYSETPV
jgi:hypothetical protein